MNGAVHRPGALRRAEQFLSERLGDLRALGFAPVDPAAERRSALHEYRRRQRQALEGGTRPDGAGLGPVPAPGPNWIPIGPLAVREGQAATKPVVSGRVPDIAVSGDGRRVYAASANGGVWRSEDGGRTWAPTMDELELNPTQRQVDSLACGAIALVEGADRDHDRLYVGTGEGHVALGLPASGYFGAGMLLSTDGGDTWTQEASAPSLEGAGVFAVAVDPVDPEHAVAATTRGLFRRRAGAAPLWQREAIGGGVAAGASITSVVAFQQAGATHVVAAASGGTVTEWSSSAGSWSVLGTGFPAADAGRLTLAISAPPSPVVYALVAKASDSGFHGLHRLDMADAAPQPWRTVAGAPANLFGDGPNFQGWYDQAAAVDPVDPDRVYVGGSTLPVGGEYSGALFRVDVATQGAGAARTFQASNTLIGASVHADLHALVFRPGGPDLWVGCDGGVFVGVNPRASGDRVFDARNVGLGTLTLNGLAHHAGEESYVFCGAQDCGGLRYTGSEVWDHQLPGDGGDTVIDWQQGARLLSIYTNNVVRRADTDGARYASTDVGPNLAGEASLFYPPLVSAPPSANPADASFLAFGATRVWVSTNFGAVWTPLPAHPASGGGARVRAIAVVSPTRLYAAWTDGSFARYDLAAPGWGVADHTRAGENRVITGIAVDPADATGQSVYVTVGGTGAGHVWRLDSSTGTPGTWADRSGTGGPNALLQVQHSAVLVDPLNTATLYAAADLGVWRSTDSGANWAVLSGNLPDAAVLDLDLHPGTRLLRATTHGRGAFELPLGVPQPGVELVLRTNAIDQRRRPARGGVAHPGQRAVTSRLDASPDIAIDAPRRDGTYAIDPTRTPTLVEIVETLTGNVVLASVPEAPAVTRVHVVARNRDVAAADGVRVALLLGPMTAAGPAPLPAGFEAVATDGTTVDADGWKTVGIRTVDGLRAGRPQVVTFDLRSDVLPVAAEADNHDFALLALVHHTDDAFPAGAPTAVTTLVTNERRSALRKVTARAASGAAVGGAGAGRASVGAPGGTGLHVPVTTALLAHQRLGDVVDQLDRKVKARRVAPGFASFTSVVRVHPVERRVLAMAGAALDALRAGPTAAVPRELPGVGIGAYALLGALGFELPAYASALAPGGGWVADTLRRGTPDPNRSLVKVPSSELPLAVGRIGVGMTAGADRDRVRAFAAGMLTAVAAGVAVGPQQADLHAIDTNADWSRHTPSTGAAALERHLRRRFLGGDDRPSTLAAWLPPRSDVPRKLWESYVRGIEEVYGLPQNRVRGFKAFEDEFDEGSWLSAVRMANAYGLVLDDFRTSSWPWPAWWALLTPILLGPSIAMLAAQSLPHARAFFEDGASVDDRAVFELLALSMGIGSVAPFVYSMVLWGAVDEHTEAFATALVLFLARAALVSGALVTASDEGQSERERWLALFLPLAGADVYALLRSIAAGRRRPGVSTVFALQTVPALTGVATLSVTSLLKALGISHGWSFWLAWALHTAGVAFGIGIPVAVALSNGGGWRSWFLRSDRRFPLLSAVAASGAVPAEPTARARVFDTSTLWSAPTVAAPDLADHAYPSGMRPLVRVWWEGAGTLEIQHDADMVVLRRPAGDATVHLPAGTTASGLAQLLRDADAGVRAELVAADDLAVALPWPRSLADPGDAGPAVDAAVVRTRFVPVGRNPDAALVLRHAPRADLSTRAGLSPESSDAVPVLPARALGDLEGAGLGAAADLAALLATAAAPTLGPVTTAGDGLPPLAAPAVDEVVQVFRRWNLDERRLEEWRTLVTGAAAPERPPAAGPDPLVRTPPGGYAGPQPVGAELVTAMGWLPLWRAWLKIATDPAADASAPFAQPSTPLVRFLDGSVRRPTNAQLTEGVRHLLDLGAA